MGSGIMLKVTTVDGGAQRRLQLPDDLKYASLVDALAAAYDLVALSVTIFSKHEGTGLWVHLGSQADLNVVLQEVSESGGHALSIDVHGVSSRRNFDAVAALVGASATLSQLNYLRWMWSDQARGLTEHERVALLAICTLALLVGVCGAAYLYRSEARESEAFSEWMAHRPGRRLLCFALAPLTLDAVPMTSCGVLGLCAPLRDVTRHAAVRVAAALLVLQDLSVLYLLKSIYWVEHPAPLQAAPYACLLLTAGSAALNLPRRLSHFALDALEASYLRRQAGLAQQLASPPRRGSSMASGAATGSPSRLGSARSPSLSSPPRLAMPSPSTGQPAHRAAWPSDRPASSTRKTDAFAPKLTPKPAPKTMV